ncbi:hypothetical protein GH714_022661 [Hevea brasiliensis]|uniref:CCHC-type domain-containing protein n=1 Tax=Hevea brasiliensis TaxID=3981 RepID=A0A6A6N679_HEVBR|nr:hypothetical protein GH714_001991 [Hevea brasiliensis]KAF2317211.1 hypothetical protein GH714_017028 [Hevea brasiliensis]KAF2320056.1 hypothetical protein GH714_022661 [Hevea brasiliensis]
MSDDKTLTKIPHFDGHYDHWSELMENLLRAKGLWSLIENGFEEPKGEMLTEAQQTQLEDARTKDHQVKHYLFQAIDRTVFEQILDRRTAKIVWDSMKKKFGGNSKVKKSLLNALRREFEVLEMKREESIDEYFARVMTVANKMRSNGEEMTDTKIVEKILRTLTGKFTYVCVSIEESKDTETMTVDELQSTLVVHEQKFKRVRKDDEDQVLKIEGRSSASRGRGSGRGRGRGRGRAVFNKATVECYKCHDLGHFQYECPKSNKEANYAELEEEDELLLMAYVELHETNRSDAWFVDSGCSNHMCGNQEMFSSLDTSFTHSVKLGNNARMKVTGKGEVKLSLKGVCYTVSDVYCVPELRNNLLSVGQLQEKGVAVLFKDGVCSLYHPLKGKMAESVMSANRMFILLGESPAAAENEKCLQVGSPDESILWHHRYGHLSYKGLRTLNSKEMEFELEWGDNISQIASGEENIVEPEPDVHPPLEVTPDVERNLAAREGRTRRPPERLTDFVSGEGLSEEDEANMMAYLVISDPTSYEEAVKERKWRLAMDEEIRSIEKNNTWCLMELPAEAKKAIWMRRVLEDIGQSQEEATILMCDNVSTIKLSKHPVLHGRSKHIRVRFHFLRDLVKEGIVDLQFCGTKDQLADLMTKPLKLDAFQKLRQGLGMSTYSVLN